MYSNLLEHNNLIVKEPDMINNSNFRIVKKILSHSIWRTSKRNTFKLIPEQKIRISNDDIDAVMEEKTKDQSINETIDMVYSIEKYFLSIESEDVYLIIWPAKHRREQIEIETFKELQVEEELIGSEPAKLVAFLRHKGSESYNPMLLKQNGFSTKEVIRVAKNKTYISFAPSINDIEGSVTRFINLLRETKIPFNVDEINLKQLFKETTDLAMYKLFQHLIMDLRMD